MRQPTSKIKQQKKKGMPQRALRSLLSSSSCSRSSAKGRIPKRPECRLTSRITYQTTELGRERALRAVFSSRVGYLKREPRLGPHCPGQEGLVPEVAIFDIRPEVGHRIGIDV